MALFTLQYTHARVRKAMYIRRGMQIICCSAKMAFIDCCTVYRGSRGGIKLRSSFLIDGKQKVENIESIFSSIHKS